MPKKEKNIKNGNGGPAAQAVMSVLKKALRALFFLTICAAMCCFLMAVLPILSAYFYSMVGTMIGLDYTNITMPDLVFWALCGTSCGAVPVTFLILGLRRFFSILYARILGTHVSGREGDDRKEDEK